MSTLLAEARIWMPPVQEKPVMCWGVFVNGKEIAHFFGKQARQNANGFRDWWNSRQFRKNQSWSADTGSER